MPYLSGFNHDLFISYCHGDDRPWIRSFYELLKPALKEQLGVEPNVWIDEQNLERSVDYRADIPESVSRSALFLLLASNQYVHSPYCVQKECAGFERTISEKHARFTAPEFHNQLFAFRTAILPVDDNDHWQIFPGASDYTFHDGQARLPIATPAFAAEFTRLVFHLANLLKRMRNHATKVFLYPRDPGVSINEAHKMLKQELLAAGYTVLPGSLLNMEKRALESALSIFLLDETYDPQTLPLMEAVAKRGQQPWVVWESPAAYSTRDPDQQEVVAKAELEFNTPARRHFNHSIRPDQLKREVMDLLRPSAQVVAPPGPRRRITLVYDPDPQKRQELLYAANIRSTWKSEFEFEYSSNARTPSTNNADGVLLIWGKAEQDWAAHQFERLANVPGRKGLCIFDPEKQKSLIQAIRTSAVADWHISEHYGQLIRAELDPFFAALRQTRPAAAGES